MGKLHVDGMERIDLGFPERLDRTELNGANGAQLLDLKVPLCLNPNSLLSTDKMTHTR